MIYLTNICVLWESTFTHTCVQEKEFVDLYHSSAPQEIKRKYSGESKNRLIYSAASSSIKTKYIKIHPYFSSLYLQISKQNANAPLHHIFSPAPNEFLSARREQIVRLGARAIHILLFTLLIFDVHFHQHTFAAIICITIFISYLLWLV